jgi:glycosyltransferase involved in cell wall biosynthesis
VYALQPLRLPNQNAEALSASGICVITAPARWHALAQTALRHRAGMVRWLGWLALPLLAPIALVDAVRRRRPFRRALQGALGRLRGGLNEALDFERWALWPLGRAMRRWPADVVHVHGWGCGQDPPGALRWLRQRGGPIVYTEHNSPDPARLSPIEAAPMNLADVLIGVSQAGAQGLRLVGQAARPVMVIPYSVKPLPPAAPAPHTGFTLTCFARLHPQKGQPILLDALARLLPQAPATQLFLAGDGPTRPELEAQVAALSLAAHVTFLGVVSRGQLPALLARTDVVVLPSYWEGLPVSLIEAISAGKAIVASRVGGNPELVSDGVNGLLVPAGDAAALAQALLSLAGDPQRVQHMGEAALAVFAGGGFDPFSVAQQHLAAYQRAMEARAA